MGRRHWLHLFSGRFSRYLPLHRSPLWLLLFYWSIVWNDLLLLIFSKKLINSRVDTVEPSRHPRGVFFPHTYFRMLWFDGLRSLLLLVDPGPSDLHSRTSTSFLDCLALVPRQFVIHSWPWSGIWSCLPPEASDLISLSLVWSLSSNHSSWQIWLARITKDYVLALTFIDHFQPDQDLLSIHFKCIYGERLYVNFLFLEKPNNLHL
jgi:hypothetical protein